MFYRRILPVVAALRRRHLGFLVVGAATKEEVSESVRVNHTTSETAATGQRAVRMSQDVITSDTSSFTTQAHSDRLLLYYDQFSYYSQKVVLALHEKNLPFDSKLVNLIKSEQYQSWFLNLNPRGEVPVLQDTGKIIPDSARIIDYLEDNFSNGDTPRLIPMDLGAEIRQKVTQFRHLLQQAPEGSLTTGAMLNQHLIKNPKTPFIGPVRKALANAEKNAGAKLREYAEKNPEAKDILLKKAANREEKYKELSVEANFMKIVDDIHKILDKVEEELSQHTGDKSNWWLCCERYTIADLELTILLVRISQLGLEHMFWLSGKRPYIEKYYERAKQRDSYKKSIPGTFVLLKSIFLSQAPLVIGIVAAVALVVGGAFIAKKYIS